jgi:hypothetical protein
MFCLITYVTSSSKGCWLKLKQLLWFDPLFKFFWQLANYTITDRSAVDKTDTKFRMATSPGIYSVIDIYSSLQDWRQQNRCLGRGLSFIIPLPCSAIISLLLQAHFGKFAGYYIKRAFYFDVHPPLGKMLNGFFGWVSGWDGQFEFESGAAYPDEVPFVKMRMLGAIPGILMVPLAWSTTRELEFSIWSRHLVTLMVLCGELVIITSKKNF